LANSNNTPILSEHPEGRGRLVEVRNIQKNFIHHQDFWQGQEEAVAGVEG
jgi:hypothetical protein